LGEQFAGFCISRGRDDETRQVGEVTGPVGEEHVGPAAAPEVSGPGSHFVGPLADFFSAAQEGGRDLEDRFHVHPRHVHADDDQGMLVNERSGELGERRHSARRLGERWAGEQRE
jgi:hypothetical protein